MFPEDSPLLAAVASYNSIEQLTSSFVTYTFMPEGSIIAGGFPEPDLVSIAWSAEEKQIVRDTFAYISSVVDLRFTEVSTEAATIALYEIPDLDDGLAGFAQFFGPGRSIIAIDSAYTRPLAFDDDNVTVIHEIGHAIGLSHPFDGPARLPGVVEENDKGDFGLNTEFVTRMSYNPGEAPLHPGVEIWGESQTFGALDIAALQLLYGANTQTGEGDTTYGDTRELETIWDVGGHDLLDFSFAGSDAVIDLRPATLQADEGGGGYLSFVAREIEDGGRRSVVADGGYSIAYGVVIEDARGGAGNDRITGNSADNLLSGNGGNDTIDGGGGTDTALFSGNQESYTLTLSRDSTTVTDRRADGDGQDTVSGIEALAFGDNTGGPFDLSIFGGAQTLSEADMESFIELYIAYFNRAPDAVGLNFWGTAFANGTTLEQMAALFIDQDETRALYPDSLTNAAFVTQVYQNALGRAADEQGFGFWVEKLDSGSVERDFFVLELLGGTRATPENPTEEFLIQQAADRQHLSVKTDIGVYYAVTRGLTDAEDAGTAMALFDGSASSLRDARDAIDTFFAAADDPTGGSFLMPLVGVLDDPFAGLV